MTRKTKETVLKLSHIRITLYFDAKVSIYLLEAISFVSESVCFKTFQITNIYFPHF